MISTNIHHTRNASVKVENADTLQWIELTTTHRSGVFDGSSEGIKHVTTFFADGRVGEEAVTVRDLLSQLRDSVAEACATAEMPEPLPTPQEALDTLRAALAASYDGDVNEALTATDTIGDLLEGRS